MLEFQFKTNRRNNILELFLYSLIIFVLALVGKSLGVNGHFLFFVASLICFIAIRAKANVLSKTIEKIVFTNGVIKVRVFDKRKNPIQIDKGDLIVFAEHDRICFRNKSYELIGNAYKKMIVDPLKWEALIDSINTTSLQSDEMIHRP